MKESGREGLDVVQQPGHPHRGATNAGAGPERVFVAPEIACTECHHCKAGHHPQCTEVKGRLPGGFAEYVLIPDDLVGKGTCHLPPSVSYVMVTFIGPLACAVRAQRLARVRAGHVVLVLGSGMSGVLNIRHAKANGCTVIATDISEGRLDYARRSGAEPDVPVDARAEFPNQPTPRPGARQALFLK